MSDQNQPTNQILTALIAKFEAARLESIANLNIYINNPTAVADHPNIVKEAACLVQKISEAEGCIATLKAATQVPGDSDASQ